MANHAYAPTTMEGQYLLPGGQRAIRFEWAEGVWESPPPKKRWWEFWKC